MLFYRLLNLAKMPVALAFLVVMVITALLAGALGYGVSYLGQKALLVDTRVETAQQRLVELQGTVNDFNRRGNVHAVTREVSRLTSNRHLKRVAIVGADGEIYHASRAEMRSMPVSRFPQIESVLRQFDIAADTRVQVHVSEDGQSLIGVLPLEPLSQATRARLFQNAYLYAEFDLNGDLQQLRYHHQSSLVYIGLAVLLLLSLSFTLLYWGIKHSIEKILTGTRRLAQGEYDYRIRLNEPNEFGQIAEAIDRMAESLAVNHRELTYLAERDLLTGLTNRYKLYQLLEKRIEEAPERPFALLFIDLDRFKIINDTLGHQNGDAYLKVIAERLQAGLSSRDIVARFGGDEFLVMLDSADRDEIHATTNRLIKALSESVVIRDQKLFTSSSVGIALYPSDGDSIHELIKAADIAMYQVKSDDSLRWSYYHESFDNNSINYLAFRTYIKQAIEAGLVVPVFQPQVDARTHEVVGYEALARMQDERGQWISPVQFLPVIEENGWMVEFSNVMYTNAMMTFEQWLYQAPLTGRPTLSLNLATMQLNHNEFLEDLDRLLNAFPQTAKLLELEITEGIFIGNIATKLPVLHAIKRRGIDIAIDDFGTGYSSLAYLKKLPLDRLKIDKSFVQDIGVDLNDNAIIETIIAMASKLGLSVVSEGVETEAQLAFLQAKDCHIIQGYLTGRPGSLPDWPAENPS
ncbi:bifunctional diguanylate cyclase/phosphodiesterase [Thiomicrospira sp. WB1]|uniref:putative bifunctional diguanylate cyclase/phosphodiesterase n=1 Tax=Thiomicrospira sp. WB1 TaxID=1685380 RepID=UPI000746B4AE|nr:GGDEF domain-containing protein [Thiomicrospira sp. WB1]KUJ72661.1 diguanylate cyclase [Thiomicrospira sp. WB1]